MSKNALNSNRQVFNISLHSFHEQLTEIRFTIRIESEIKCETL